MKKQKKIIGRSCLVLMLVGICAFLFLGSKRKNYFVNERPVPDLIISPRLCPIKENHKQEKKYTKEHSKEDTIYGSSLIESTDTLNLKGK